MSLSVNWSSPERMLFSQGLRAKRVRVKAVRNVSTYTETKRVEGGLRCLVRLNKLVRHLATSKYPNIVLSNILHEIVNHAMELHALSHSGEQDRLRELANDISREVLTNEKIHSLYRAILLTGRRRGKPHATSE
jgi:hypothetical protein